RRGARPPPSGRARRAPARTRLLRPRAGGAALPARGAASRRPRRIVECEAAGCTRVAEKPDDRAAEALPAAPDLAHVNASWTTKPPLGLLGRLLAWLQGPQLEAQRAFNADQVRLDNALLKYLEERLAATHRHYDRILGRTGQRLDEVD